MSTPRAVARFLTPRLESRLATCRSSSVHPPELKSDFPDHASGGLSSNPQHLAETFRHSGWRRKRRLIYEALYRTAQTRTRTSAFSSCGATAFVYRSLDPPYRYRLAGSSCHDKFCDPCARDRSRCIATNVLNHLDGNPARFITLTLAHNAAPLIDQVKRLQRCFARLRANRAWRTHVSGGAAFIEVKWIEASQQWHPHFHVICEGRYFPHDLLKAAWWRITGDSYIADIRPVKDERSLARYVVKYASKPANDTFIGRPVRLDEVIVAFRGRRLCHTFGTWRGLRLTESPSEGAWLAIGSFYAVAHDAASGDADACDAIAQICGDLSVYVLAVVDKARPPPEIPPPVDRQLTFAWPPIDNRF